MTLSLTLNLALSLWRNRFVQAGFRLYPSCYLVLPISARYRRVDTSSVVNSMKHQKYKHPM